jgi:3-isopropylmalate/(R)-2-methylmalate dehydratase small subunit
MPVTPFTPFTSPYAVLAADNVDTDQIIPARFLKTTERTGLGRYLLHDWRAGGATGTPLADAPRGARVLVTGANFGCGSSREHAVWALADAGFHAVVAVTFADIFRLNALGNGLLPIAVDRAITLSGDFPTVSVDLATQQLTLPDGRVVEFPIDPFAKHCLLAGIDEMDFLLAADADISAFEAARDADALTGRVAS